MNDFLCPKCSAPLHEDDFNIRLGVAKCRHCRAWSPIEVPAATTEAAGDRTKPKSFAVPEKFEIVENYDELTIEWRWFNWVILFLIPFCVVWNGFLVFWYSMVLGMGDHPGAPSLFFLVAPLIHVAVGVGLTYSTLAGLFNSTTISVKRDLLSVRHGPLPWLGQHDVQTFDLEQLYCNSRISRGKNTTTTYYSVHALLQGGKELKLISNLTNKQEALYLEYKIEQHLGIEDAPVAGEMS